MFQCDKRLPVLLQKSGKISIMHSQLERITLPGIVGLLSNPRSPFLFILVEDQDTPATESPPVSVARHMANLVIGMQWPQWLRKRPVRIQLQTSFQMW